MKFRVICLVVTVFTAGLLMGSDVGTGCSAPTLDTGGECKQASDCESLAHTDCTGRWLCQSNACTWDCTAGGTCATDADCASAVITEIGCADGTVPQNLCVSGKCQLTCGGGQDCKSNEECPSGQYCQVGTCPLCPDSSNGYACPTCTGKCISEQFPCSSDKDCPTGYYCMFDPNSGKETTDPSTGCTGATDASPATKCVMPNQGVCAKNPDEYKCVTDSDCPKGYICATAGSTNPGDASKPRCAGIKCVPTDGVCIPGDKCFCNDVYAPVCGTDGVTYGNPCYANCAWVRIAHEGECKPVCTCYAKYGEVCGKDYACDAGYECDPVSGGCCDCGPACKKELVCKSDKECPIGTTGWQCINGCCELRGCACPLYYSPVCGKDGKTYPNECEAKCAGVGVVSKGECQSTGCYSDKECPSGYYCQLTNKCSDPTANCGGAGVCTPIGCQPVACPLYCEYGFEKDASGCDLCKCRPNPGECKTYTDSSGNTCTICCDSSTGSCSETCNGGCAGSIQCKSNDECLAINKAKMVCQNGCCVPESCEPVTCDLYCEYGYLLDANGCEICKCNTPPIECKTYYDSSGNLCETCCDPATGQCYDKCSGGCAGLPACASDADCSNSGGVMYYVCVSGCCQKKPVDCNCTKEYMPVCGLDNVTYGNACEAECRSGGVSYKGPCHGPCSMMPGSCKDDSGCPKGMGCFDSTCCQIL